MTKSDPPLVALSDIPTAIGLLTRFPVPGQHGTRMAQAAWAYPLAGLLPAGLAALIGTAAMWSGLPAPLTALLALAAMVITTGALHEDGLADTADGLWGGWDRDRRLEIMKDSRIGAYGVIAIAFSLAARWAALSLLFEQGIGAAVTALLGVAVLSRAGMPVLMAALPHARETGLSHKVGQVRPATAGLAVATGLVLGLTLLGIAGIWAAVWAALTTLALGLIARAKIGGQTGDILGAAQQLAEIALLFSLLA